jgi:hypothetical protein
MPSGLPGGQHHEDGSEYLARAVEFERMADDATDPEFKEQQLKQAAAHRKVAAECAEKRFPPASDGG